MTAITITVGGSERTITDVTAYRADLASTAQLLDNLYAGFDPARPEPLLAQEEEVVKLYNRYQELRAIVDQWDASEKSRENVLAAWALVQQIREGGVS